MRQLSPSFRTPRFMRQAPANEEWAGVFYAAIVKRLHLTMAGDIAIM